MQEGLQKAVNHLVRLEAAVESGSRSQPSNAAHAGYMLRGRCRAGRFSYYTDHGVEPLEQHLIIKPAILAGNNRLVLALAAGDSGKAV